MTLRAFAMWLVLPLLACGGSGDDAKKADGGEKRAGKGEKASQADKGGAPPGAEEAAAAATENRFEPKKKEVDTCKFLTEDMVAKTMGVDAGELEQRGGNRTHCRYDWGKNSVALWHWDAKESVEGAKKAFARDYGDKTGEDVAKAVDQVKQQVDKQDAKGKLEVDGKKVDADQAKAVADATAGAVGGGFQYEGVEGVGDQATWNKTKRVMNVRGTEITSYDNKLHVLVSNAMFQIEVHVEEGRPTRDEAVALAKLVVAALP